jgi:hypothetical protein
MIIQAEIAEVSVSRPIIGSLCHTSQEQSIPFATLVPTPYPKEDPVIQGGILTTTSIRGIDTFMPPPYLKEDPQLSEREEFYDYPDQRDRRFYATSLSEGGPPYLNSQFDAFRFVAFFFP